MVDEYGKKDDNGPYRLLGLRNRNQSFNPTTRPNLYYPIYVDPETRNISLDRTDSFHIELWPDAPTGVKTCWTWKKDKVRSESHLLCAEPTNDEWRIYRKDYLHGPNGEIAKSLVKSLWTDKEITIEPLAKLQFDVEGGAHGL